MKLEEANLRILQGGTTGKVGVEVAEEDER
jgi:hypothetical protein